MSTRRPVNTLRLIGGVRCLDFVNTVDPRHTAVHEEYLDSYRGLVEWAMHAGLEPPASASRLAQLGDERPAQAARVLARAVSLREALYDLFAPGSPARARDDALAVLNEELRRAWSCALVARDGERHALRFVNGDALDRVLWPVTLSAFELLVSAPTRVKECDGDQCGWLFVNTSKAGRRRWCSMESCGNRAKVQRYRARDGTRA